MVCVYLPSKQIYSVAAIDFNSLFFSLNHRTAKRLGLIVDGFTKGMQLLARNAPTPGVQRAFCTSDALPSLIFMIRVVVLTAPCCSSTSLNIVLPQKCRLY